MKLRYFWAVAVAMVAASCAGSPEVRLEWKVGEYDAERDMQTYHIAVEGLDKVKGDWELYFAQFPFHIENDPESPLQVEETVATHHRIHPGGNFVMAPRIEGRYFSDNIIYHRMAPERAFVLVDGKKTIPVEISTAFPPLPSNGEELYAEYEHFKKAEVGRFDMIPSVKSCTVNDGSLSYENGIIIKADAIFATASAYLKWRITGKGDGKPVEVEFISSPESRHKDFYRIEQKDGRVSVSASSLDAAFYAAVTLANIIDGDEDPEVENFIIEDYPDMAWRGTMMDVARNFTSKENMIRLLGLLARYKVNVLHFHLIDDEGWRVEIDGIEELTGIGAHHDFDRARGLEPSYDGCYDAEDETSTSNGFYTVEDMIEILQYADAMHIKVIPEIESPGHARAAVKAMMAYAERTGDHSMDLHDPDDRSEYYSAQYYRDNVMNVAMESCYTFMARVIDSLRDTYLKAGLELDEVHIGGDEVPEGSWTGSPICQEFMKENGMSTAKELTAYFIGRMRDICVERGMKMSCWQDLPMTVDTSHDAGFTPAIYSVNCWNTIPEWGGDHVPYTLANRGYPVILSNVGNGYADMVYSNHPEERGHHWAGKLNEKMAFSLLPYDIYRSSRWNLDGSEADFDKARVGKPELKRPENVKGVQAQLFAETIRSFDDVTYCLFPKILGVFERGWNARPDWSLMRGEAEKEAFGKAYEHFYGVIVGREMPFYENEGLEFRIPAPGLRVADGKLYANSLIEDGVIRYTLDGSIPCGSSAVWTGPVDVPADCVVHARLYYCGEESVTTKL